MGGVPSPLGPMGCLGPLGCLGCLGCLGIAYGMSVLEFQAECRGGRKTDLAEAGGGLEERGRFTAPHTVTVHWATKAKKVSGPR